MIQTSGATHLWRIYDSRGTGKQRGLTLATRELSRLSDRKKAQVAANKIAKQLVRDNITYLVANIQLIQLNGDRQFVLDTITF